MKILHKQLLALVCAATIGTGAVLHAQDDYPAPAKTPEEAAANFYRLIQITRDAGSASAVTLDEVTLRSIGSTSRPQFEALWTEEGRKALELLVRQSFGNAFESKTVGSSGDQTIVLVAPGTQPKAREVVVVPEDGGYRVDIVATYGRWNNLSGLDADKALYQKTGWLSPLLSQQADFRGSATNAQCQSYLKQQMLGIAQYTQDYDEKMPPASKWIDVVRPYTKSEQVFRCPALGKAGNGYAFNSKFSGKSVAYLNSLATPINVYETSNPARNVFAPFTGRAYRHEQNGQPGMNIGFADGHVKWFAKGKQAQISTNPAVTTPGFTTISTQLTP